MSVSIQSQVIAAIVALLNAVGGPRAYRTRITTFGTNELPAYNVLPAEDDTEYETTDGTEHRFRFTVRNTAQSVDEVDVAVDALYVAGHKAILADPTLGGLVHICRERGSKWEFEDAEHDMCALAVTYEVEFSTSRSDPSVKLF